jgi:hypothetical protein
MLPSSQESQDTPWPSATEAGVALQRRVASPGDPAAKATALDAAAAAESSTCAPGHPTGHTPTPNSPAEATAAAQAALAKLADSPLPRHLKNSMRASLVEHLRLTPGGVDSLRALGLDG